MTKAGSSQFHGSLYHYSRDSRFAANDRSNSIAGTEKPKSTYQYPGGNIGGQIPDVGSAAEVTVDTSSLLGLGNFLFDAILIDGDNAQSTLLPQMLVEAGRHGQVTVRRIYGDWTTSNMNSWKETLNFHAFQPIQQFRYTIGKNATDSAMIIDAMDLLYTGNFTGFCLVSSDSDFTRLASRLRESGLTVFGFGEKKTPLPFVSACDKFIYTEVLREGEEEGPEASRRSTRELKSDAKLVNSLRNAVESSSDDSGWAPLAAVGSNIVKQFPDFDSRNYGYRKLGELVAATDLFDIEERPSRGESSKVIYIHDKRKK